MALKGTAEERQLWMDLVRGWAIVMVLCHHSLYIATLFAGQAPEVLRMLDRFWEPFRMPTLIFLSGMLLSRSLQKPPETFIRGKVQSLAWPYWLWSILFLAMSGALTFKSVLLVLLAPPTYLWYLWYLFACYLAALAFSRARVPLWAVIIASYGISIFITKWLGLADFFYMFVFFLLGHLYIKHQRPINEMLAPRWAVVALAVVTLATGVVSALEVHHVKFEAAWILGVVGGTALAIRVAPLVREGPLSGGIKWVGGNSIVFYLAHWPAMWMASALLSVVHVNSPYVYIGSNLVLGLVVSWAIADLRHRWPPLHALFLWPRRESVKAV